MKYFNSKYSSDNTAKLFGYSSENNIENSNLEKTINQPDARKAGAHDVKLLYVTSKNGKPMKSLILRHLSSNKNTYYSPSPPDPGKNYESIFDKTEQNKGKIVAQNIGEGARSTLKEGMWSYAVNGNTFLEFTRD